MAEQRRLATILALDVSGYSRAAERDDSAAADSVRRLRATITEVAAPFGGRIFNSAGDGFMLEFPSAASGVQAAMELLKESRSGKRPLPKIRIGLHLGDVIVEENGDLLGHGVNVAARLQALAEPGAAIVSETVRAQVRSVAELPFTSHGRVQLDKMSERLAVYSLSPGHASLFGGLSRKRAARGALLALSLIAACGVGYGAWRLWSAGGAGAATSISLYQDESEGRERALTAMGFTAERSANGRLSIRVDFPYRERLEREHRADGLSFWRTPFLAALPTLLVQVTNTGARPLSLNEIQFEVIRATPNETPLPFVRESPLDLHRIVIVNAGWGSWESPRLDITAWGLPEEFDRARQVSGAGVVSYEPCANPTRLMRAPAVSVAGVTDDDGATIFPLDGRIPSAFADELFVCAVGQLSYTHGGRQVRLDIRSRVSNRLPDAFVASPAIATYDLYLDPARQDYVAIVPVMRDIPPGATDSIALTIYADRSSQYTLRHSVRTSTGAKIDGDVFDLEILVPRQSDVGFALNETSRMAVPESAVAAEDRSGVIERASFDPQGREPVRFHARRTISTETCEAFLREIAPRVLQRAGIAGANMAVIDPDGAYLCQTPARTSGR